MRRNMLRVLSLTVAAVLLSTFAFAQDSRLLSAVGDMYVISAKAGGVNFIEGKVSIARKKGKSGLLLKGDNVEIGDKVLTGTSGKAEILLNPGSYLRLSENSTFEFVSTELDNLQIKLNSGTAIFEVYADDEFNVAIDTPKTDFFLVKSGVYRIDIAADGSEKIEVWKGRAQIGNAEVNIVKGGNVVVIRNGQQQTAKFDRDEKDEFELWSRLRAKELAKINSKLERNLMKTSLLNSYNRQSWNLYDSFGVWVVNRNNGTHCFLPFGYGWRSPYGYGFGYHLGNYNLPWYVFYPPRVIQTVATGNNNIPSESPNPRTEKHQSRFNIPPFEKVQGRESREPRNNDDFNQSAPINSSPIRVEPAPAPAPRTDKTRDN